MSLTAFLEKGYTAYHVTAILKERLLKEGFSALKESESFCLTAGGKYFVTRGDASLIAFVLPKEIPTGFQIAAAHNDSPAFYITGEKHDGALVRLTVERYGGPHSATWFDRPLKLAGRVFVKDGKGGVASRLFESDGNLFIPSVAPHQNREAENKVLSNPAVDLLPVFAKDTEADLLKKSIAQKLSCDISDIVSSDLYLVSDERPTLWGDDFVSAPRLDDLACVYSLMDGFLTAHPQTAVPVLAVFHGEEVGSMLFEGANSEFLNSVLSRIAHSLDTSYDRMLAGSFMLSVDNAHAIHPAHPELYHAEAHAHMNGGIVLKHACSRRYTTDAFSYAMTRTLCESCGVPVQEFRNRADMPGGGTLGAIAATHVSVPCADIGLAQLAMHSACETGGVKDVAYLTARAEHYFSVALSYTDDGACWR